MRRLSQVVLCSLLLGVLPHSASAQNKKEDSEEIKKQKQALQRFEEAEKLYNIGDFKGALDGYKEAYLLSNNPDLLFNMGQCYRKLEQYQEALTTYKSYLREVPNSPVKADVEARIAEVEKLAAENQVSKLVITSSPTGAEVHKGGASSRVLGVTPYTEEKLPAGEYHFTLTYKGYQPYEFDLNVEGGKDYAIPEAKMLPVASTRPVWAYLLSFSGGFVANATESADSNLGGGSLVSSLERYTPARNKSYGVAMAIGGSASASNSGQALGHLMLGGNLFLWKPLRWPLWSLGYGGSAGVVGLTGVDEGPGIYARGQLRLSRAGEYRGALYIRPLDVGFSLGGDYRVLDIGLLGLGYSWGLRKK